MPDRGRDPQDSWDQWERPDYYGPPDRQRPQPRTQRAPNQPDSWDRWEPREPRRPREPWSPAEQRQPRSPREPAPPPWNPRAAEEQRGRPKARDPRDRWNAAESSNPRDYQDSWDRPESAERRYSRDVPSGNPRGRRDDWGSGSRRQTGDPRSRRGSRDAHANRDPAAGDPAEELPWNGQDELPLFGDEDPSARRPGGRRTRRAAAKERSQRRRRRRVLSLFIVIALLAGLGVGAWFGWQELRGIGDVPDYAGTGEAEVIAQVVDGASTTDIGTELARLDVVASSKAFVNAAQGNAKIRSVQPGYYRMRTKMSGASAVSLLLEPTSRVGRLEIRGGMQLDDVKLPDGKVVPGILSLISNASKAELNGQNTQVPVEQLRQAIETTDPAAIGVPQWALPGVQAAEPRRRLEGLLVPGTYDVRPGASVVDLLKSVMAASSLRLQATALTDESKNTGFSPYELLIIASIVEKEGITADFGKVSRVIYNRMANQMPLGMDSTINYPLERQEVRTTNADRERPGPYNTYKNQGLPPTPIGSPSEKAIAAAIQPEPGGWLYFVKCQTDGTSCFAETGAQHQANVDDARARGIF